MCSKYVYSYLSISLLDTFSQGMAFTLKERQVLGIHGLIPPAVLSQHEQITRVRANLNNHEDPLEKHVYLSMLQVGVISPLLSLYFPFQTAMMLVMVAGPK